IIINDGCTDETPEIVKSYKDNRIKYFRHEKNKGLPSALNTGFSRATGEYLTWISDDNLYLPEAIEKMVYCLKENKGIDLVYADYLIYYQETGKKELNILPDILNLKKVNSVGCCFLYTRRVYQNIGDYNPKYVLLEDYDYWIRICARYSSMHYPHMLCIYTDHPGTLTSTRTYEIALFENILKYQNNYISVSELGMAIYYSFLGFISLNRKKNIMSIFIQNIFRIYIFRIFYISIPLGLLCSLMLIYSLVINKLKFYIRIFFEYIDFFFSFKQNCDQLKTSKNKKNILCVVPYMIVGGSEKVILNIAKVTDKEKFSFHIITTKPANNVWYNKYNSIFQNIIIPYKRLEISNIYKMYFFQLIKSLNIDIVLISDSLMGYKYLPKLKSEFQHVKTLDVLHVEDSPGARPELKWVTPFLDRRVCISEHLREYIVEENKVTEDSYVDRFRVIYNGIDINEYNPNFYTKGKFKSKYGIPEDVKIISFIGRIEPEKNPFLFFDIAHNITYRSTEYKIKFVIVGDGDDLDKIRNIINNSGIKDNFILTGMIDNIAEVLADTYILLITSKSEGIPLVILEAMAMEVPVISTDVGGIHEVINDNINGYLINPENNVVELFTVKILDLLSGNLNYSAIAGKTRETIVYGYSLETMGEKYQDLFNELLQKK
ncbi:MAG: glycosyltransferase, partial [Candidatus Methanoperedens sp.]|nr:glycosyltransferase [Candidatus Methanoperedens sp.]